MGRTISRTISGTIWLLVLLPACSTIPEHAEYLHGDRANRLADTFQAARSYCSSVGRVIVIEQNRTGGCSVRARRANGGLCPPEQGDTVRGCAL